MQVKTLEYDRKQQETTVRPMESNPGERGIAQVMSALGRRRRARAKAGREGGARGASFGGGVCVCAREGIRANSVDDGPPAARLQSSKVGAAECSHLRSTTSSPEAQRPRPTMNLTLSLHFLVFGLEQKKKITNSIKSLHITHCSQCPPS
ncbi:hypothetical protein MPTK1_6g07790 [Marchantia polymorpha subsp. ruderalis]|uniref:Uncharacterized protein n=2 Tax=Marchantia polymorpha TaxID=3197 RepID=A0AAF6BPN3_MARPO|nr:hypothetical protein MARPO_0053s0092 [Marchantia polymorpha]BBN13967.1 hypothetical protein Mp_6g07790 [Marchantia polymorpha subsp. ruderalis]|eukprot:PTQ38168.1 hypothetical protein MARPO_0053s0092 [Marchantia polymorpha]